MTKSGKNTWEPVTSGVSLCTLTVSNKNIGTMIYQQLHNIRSVTLYSIMQWSTSWINMNAYKSIETPHEFVGMCVREMFRVRSPTYSPVNQRIHHPKSQTHNAWGPMINQLDIHAQPHRHLLRHARQRWVDGQTVCDHLERWRPGFPSKVETEPRRTDPSQQTNVTGIRNQRLWRHPRNADYSYDKGFKEQGRNTTENSETVQYIRRHRHLVWRSIADAIFL